MRISVIVPVYNEESFVIESIKRIRDSSQEKEIKYSGWVDAVNKTRKSN